VILGPKVSGCTRSTATVLGTNMRRSGRSASVILKPPRRGRSTTVILRTSASGCRGRSATTILRTEVPCRAGTAVFKPVPTTARPTVREIMRLPGRGTTRSDNSVPRELARTRSSRHHRPTVIHGLPEVPVGRREVLMIPLHRGRLEMTITLRSHLMRSRTRMEPTRATVETNAVHGHVVDDRAVVHVRHVNRAEVSARVVIEERATAPVTTCESNTGISEAVIDTAVETDVRPPVAAMP